MIYMYSNSQSDDRERGAGIVEYVLLVGLIAVAGVVGVSVLGNAVSASMITPVAALGQEASPTTTVVPVSPGKSADAGQTGRERSDEARDQGSPTTTVVPVSPGKSADAGQTGRERSDITG